MTTKEYNKCVEDFSDNVYRFILKNIRRADKAQDIVQDSFEKMWRNKKSIDYKKAKSYLFTTAYHTMIDGIRKNKRIVSSDENEYAEPSHSRQFTDTNEVLNQALAKLPEIQRSVIMLRDYEGYPYKEIAEITDLSESQVKVYIYRARVALKNYIGRIENVL